MSAITPSATLEAQGIFHIVKFTDVDDGENYASTTNAPKAFWAQMITDPSTNTSAGINVTWDSTNGYVFYPGVDNADVYLFIVQ